MTTTDQTAPRFTAVQDHVGDDAVHDTQLDRYAPFFGHEALALAVEWNESLEGVDLESYSWYRPDQFRGPGTTAASVDRVQAFLDAYTYGRDDSEQTIMEIGRLIDGKPADRSLLVDDLRALLAAAQR